MSRRARGRAERRGRVCEARRVGGAAAQPAPTRELAGLWAKHTEAKRRGRPREAHAAAHRRIVPVDVPSKADQPLELRHVVVACSLEHGLAHRVAHRARRALRARSDTCGFGGTRAARLTLERRRALSRGAQAARPQAPRSSGGGGSRGARARRGHSKRPRRAAATPGSRGPEQVAWVCDAAGEPRPRTWAKQAIGLDERIGQSARARHADTLTSNIDI